MRYRMLTASVAALAILSACDRTTTAPMRTTSAAALDQGPGGGGIGVISLGGTWTGTFTPTINGTASTPQTVTVSLNQSNQAITGTAVFAVASDPTQKVVDTVVGLTDGNFVDLHFTSVATGITQLNYPATITQLEHGGTSLTGDMNFIDPFQVIGPLELVRR
jgi:hypothetical protein